jgi:adenylyltransferase/sulfurtransferase
LAKTKVLGNWLLAQNPETELTLYDCFLTAHNALDILRSYRLIIDATDNLNTRYLIDDACLILGLPWIYGALYGFEGQISVFNYKNGPTYRCLFPNKPNLGEIPDCNTLGTLGVLPGIIGNLQALEAVKLLSGLPGILSGTILMYDAIRQEFRHFKLRRNPNRKSNLKILDGLEYTLNPSLESISLNDYFSVENASTNQILVDVREPEEFEEFSIPNSRNIPLHNLQSKLAYLSAFDQIFLVCKSGPRSMRAYELIKRELPNSYVKWISGGVEEFKTMEL